MKINGILETCLYAKNLNGVEKFYKKIPGLSLYSKVEGRHVFFKSSTGMLLIFNPDKTGEPGQDVPPHGSVGEGHAAFSVPKNEFDSWKSLLQENGVEIEKEVTWKGGGKSLYVRDPAGNSIEFAMPNIWGFR